MTVLKLRLQEPLAHRISRLSLQLIKTFFDLMLSKKSLVVEF